MPTLTRAITLNRVLWPFDLSQVQGFLGVTYSQTHWLARQANLDSFSGGSLLYLGASPGTMSTAAASLDATLPPEEAEDVGPASIPAVVTYTAPDEISHLNINVSYWFKKFINNVPGLGARWRYYDVSEVQRLEIGLQPILARTGSVYAIPWSASYRRELSAPGGLQITYERLSSLEVTCGGPVPTTFTLSGPASDHGRAHDSLSFDAHDTGTGTLSFKATSGGLTGRYDLYLRPVITVTSDAPTANDAKDVIHLDGSQSFCVGLPLSSPLLSWEWSVAYLPGAQKNTRPAIDYDAAPYIAAQTNPSSDTASTTAFLTLGRLDFPVAGYENSLRGFGSTEFWILLDVGGRLVALLCDPSGLLLRSKNATVGSTKVLAHELFNGSTWAPQGTLPLYQSPSLAQVPGEGRAFLLAQRTDTKAWHLLSSDDLGAQWSDPVSNPFPSTFKAVTGCAHPRGVLVAVAIDSGGVGRTRISHDDGLNWEDGGSPGSGAKSLDLKAATDGSSRIVLLADAWSMQSDDFGATWQPLGTP